ncbi:nuclear transport factor 2 family protein [Paenarthrobacter sp. RAF54_2]|uniref:nuclear transport factor 2 family protein n=1 Tax=Paenarthrobacter sp. RAF54_2 TaxID=3233061 RepID=UPI003F9E7239
MNDTNLQLFKTQMAAYGQMDIDMLMTSFDDKAVLQDMSEPDSLWVGSSEIRRFLTEYFAHLSEVQVTIASVATSSNRVFAELEVNAKYSPDAGSPSDIHDVVMRYCVVETFSQGRIVHERFYWDRSEFESQLSSAPKLVS